MIIREYRTCQDFLLAVEPKLYQGKINELDKLTLSYLSKTVLSGVRPYELEILKRLSDTEQLTLQELSEELKKGLSVFL